MREILTGEARENQVYGEGWADAFNQGFHKLVEPLQKENAALRARVAELALLLDRWTTTGREDERDERNETDRDRRTDRKGPPESDL